MTTLRRTTADVGVGSDLNDGGDATPFRLVPVGELRPATMVELDATPVDYAAKQDAVVAAAAAAAAQRAASRN